MNHRDLQSALATCDRVGARQTPGVFRVVARSSLLGESFLVAVSPDGWPSVLISAVFANSPAGFVTRAMAAHPRRAVVVEIDGRPARTMDVVVVECRDINLLDAFAVVVSEASNEPDGGRRSWPTIHEALYRWSNLFAGVATIDERTLQGLWGELWLLARSRTPDVLLAGWRGPERGVADFVVSDRSLEVKTSRRPFVHDISYAQRSLFPERGFVFSMAVEASGAGDCVGALIEKVAARINEPRILYAALRDLGISLAALQEHDRPRCLISAPALFPISAIPSVHDIDPGVSDLKYKVNLDPARALVGEDRRAAVTPFGLDEAMEVFG